MGKYTREELRAMARIALDDVRHADGKRLNEVIARIQERFGMSYGTIFDKITELAR